MPYVSDEQLEEFEALQKAKEEAARNQGIVRRDGESTTIYQSEYERAQLPELEQITVDAQTQAELRGARSAEDAIAILERKGFQQPAPVEASTVEPYAGDPGGVLEAARNASSAAEAVAILRNAGITHARYEPGASR
jgi:hypothetical protein